jgi:ABC-type lipoprotein export system ATPase subunit/bifunctional DNA-binding transcriptional regulator/antitoxin component of YhaV-PrlF toxin-antitoxin module
MPASTDELLSADTAPLIVCENLVKIYKVADLEVVALQGLDLLIQRGELMGIVGPSGSGKTSLMNILGGLDRPSAGRVWVDGNDLLKMSDVALDRYSRAKVGFIWQQSARNLIPYMKAQANVELPLTLAGVTGRRKRRRAAELLELVGLGDRRRHQLAQLSGGEQQRVAIAVSLANDPVLLLGDEPTGEVDSTTALTIYDTLKTLNSELGLTILLVSHDPTISRHVQRVVAIRDGKMATETVRQTSAAAASNGNGESDEAVEEVEEVFEELIVLDSAGRLQVPKDYLEQFNINRRVKLEVIEDGILIKPVSEADRRRQTEDTTSTIAEMMEASKTKGLRGLLTRFRRGKKT